MQHTKKLFRNCPHDRRRRCKGCVNYNRCVAKKVKRRIKKAARIYGKSYLLLIVLVIIAISTLVIMHNYNTKQRQKLEEDSNHIIFSTVADYETPIPTTTVTVSKSEVYNSAQPTCTSVEIITKDDDMETEEEEEQQTENEETEEPKATISAYGPSETYYYTVTNEERKALEKLVYQESRGEPLKGQVAVAATVLNRYTSKSKEFDTSSIIAVIVDKNQFADISSVTQSQLDSVPSCREAVEAALKGWDPTRIEFPNGAKYFYEPNEVEGYQKEIREGIHVYQIGNHYFHENFDK